MIALHRPRARVPRPTVGMQTLYDVVTSVARAPLLYSAPMYAKVAKQVSKTPGLARLMLMFDKARSAWMAITGSALASMPSPIGTAAPRFARKKGLRTIEELMAEAAALKVFIIVLEEKGGVGKSVCCATAYETMRLTCERVLLLDADFVNKNLSRVGLTTAEQALDAARVDFEGFLWDAAEQLISGETDAVVIDSAAGGERYFRPHLAELGRHLRSNGARLVVMRPITTSPLVHDNALTFVQTAMTADIGVVMVRNLGQGRVPEDFIDFDTSPEYKELQAVGAVECRIESAGARYSDLATSFGRSFADIAMKQPDELGLEGRHLEIARRVFTRPVQLFLARWLFRQTEAFSRAIVASLVRTL